MIIGIGMPISHNNIEPIMISGSGQLIGRPDKLIQEN